MMVVFVVVDDNDGDADVDDTGKQPTKVRTPSQISKKGQKWPKNYHSGCMMMMVIQ